MVRLDVARRSGQSVNRPPTKHDRSRCPIEFGNGDHHGGLNRRKPSVGTLPFLDRLKFKRLRGDIRHVEVAQHFRVTVPGLRRWVAKGEFPIPHSTIAQTWYYQESVIRHRMLTGEWPEGVKFIR